MPIPKKGSERIALRKEIDKVFREAKAVQERVDREKNMGIPPLPLNFEDGEALNGFREKLQRSHNLEKDVTPAERERCMSILQKMRDWSIVVNEQLEALKDQREALKKAEVSPSLNLGVPPLASPGGSHAPTASSPISLGHLPPTDEDRKLASEIAEADAAANRVSNSLLISASRELEKEIWRRHDDFMKLGNFDAGIYKAIVNGTKLPNGKQEKPRALTAKEKEECVGNIEKLKKWTAENQEWLKKNPQLPPTDEDRKLIAEMEKVGYAAFSLDLTLSLTAVEVEAEMWRRKDVFVKLYIDLNIPGYQNIVNGATLSNGRRMEPRGLTTKEKAECVARMERLKKWTVESQEWREKNPRPPYTGSDSPPNLVNLGQPSLADDVELIKEVQRIRTEAHGVAGTLSSGEPRSEGERRYKLYEKMNGKLSVYKRNVEGYTRGFGANKAHIGPQMLTPNERAACKATMRELKKWTAEAKEWRAKTPSIAPVSAHPKAIITPGTPDTEDLRKKITDLQSKIIRKTPNEEEREKLAEKFKPLTEDIDKLKNLLERQDKVRADGKIETDALSPAQKEEIQAIAGRLNDWQKKVEEWLPTQSGEMPIYPSKTVSSAFSKVAADMAAAQQHANLGGLGAMGVRVMPLHFEAQKKKYGSLAQQITPPVPLEGRLLISREEFINNSKKFYARVGQGEYGSDVKARLHPTGDPLEIKVDDQFVKRSLPLGTSKPQVTITNPPQDKAIFIMLDASADIQPLTMKGRAEISTLLKIHKAALMRGYAVNFHAADQALLNASPEYQQLEIIKADPELMKDYKKVLQDLDSPLPTTLIEKIDKIKAQQSIELEGSSKNRNRPQ
jgi:hypothetical protein